MLLHATACHCMLLQVLGSCCCYISFSVSDLFHLISMKSCLISGLISISFEALLQVKVGDKVPADMRLVELHSSMIRVEQPLGKKLNQKKKHRTYRKHRGSPPTITKLENFSKPLLQSPIRFIMFP